MTMDQRRSEPTVEQYYEAFKRSYSRLKDALPINTLLPYFFEVGAVPGDLKAKLNSIPIRSDKVICLLDEMELGLKVGITDQFESFVSVMEKFGGENNNIVVKRLAADIRLILSKPTVKPSSVQHSSTDKLLGRCVLILFVSTLLFLVVYKMISKGLSIQCNHISLSIDKTHLKGIGNVHSNCWSILVLATCFVTYCVHLSP